MDDKVITLPETLSTLYSYLLFLLYCFETHLLSAPSLASLPSQNFVLFNRGIRKGVKWWMNSWIVTFACLETKIVQDTSENSLYPLETI